jgi:hypothetical protein
MNDGTSSLIDKTHGIWIEELGEGEACSSRYYRKQICKFCKLPQVKLIPHLERMHREEEEVQQLMSLEKNSTERKTLCTKLRNDGNFKHNIDVLKKKSGNLIVSRRPSKAKNCKVSDFLPCASCLGFFFKEDLWRHCKFHCSLTKNNDDSGVLKIGKNIIATMTSEDDNSQFSKILVRMKNEDFVQVIKKDPILMRYGQNLCEKYALNKNLDNFIREKVREMVRLMMPLQKLNPNSTLEDFLCPEKFDDIIGAVHSVTGKGEKIITPSLAVKMGHGLKKCAAIKIGQCLRRGDQDGRQRTQDFLTLVENEWSLKVSKNALETLKKNLFNKPMVIPLTEDLKHLVIKICEETSGMLQKEILSVQEYRRLAELALGRVILFNKRRTGEASLTTVDAYSAAKLTREENKNHESEIFSSLTAVEKQLAKSLLLLETRGKRDRKVPILLPVDAQQAIELLIKNRKNCGISDTNQFLFPLPGFETSLRGWEVLNKLAKEFGCQRPELITGTKLRKYLATTAQAMNLAENEMDWLANHLGHDIKVHRQFYRLQESSVELAKVSKLLLASEKGLIPSDYKGLKIDDIDVTAFLQDEEDDGEEQVLDFKKLCFEQSILDKYYPLILENK